MRAWVSLKPGSLYRHGGILIHAKLSQIDRVMLLCGEKPWKFYELQVAHELIGKGDSRISTLICLLTGNVSGQWQGRPGPILRPMRPWLTPCLPQSFCPFHSILFFHFFQSSKPFHFILIFLTIFFNFSNSYTISLNLNQYLYHLKICKVKPFSKLFFKPFFKLFSNNLKWS